MGFQRDFNGISMGSNMSKRLENQHEDFWAILWDLMGERPNMMIFKASKNDVGFNVNPGIWVLACSIHHVSTQRTHELRRTTINQPGVILNVVNPWLAVHIDIYINNWKLWCIIILAGVFTISTWDGLADQIEDLTSEIMNYF